MQILLRKYMKMIQVNNSIFIYCMAINLLANIKAGYMLAAYLMLLIRMEV